MLPRHDTMVCCQLLLFQSLGSSDLARPACTFFKIGNQFRFLICRGNSSCQSLRFQLLRCTLCYNGIAEYSIGSCVTRDPAAVQ